MTIIIIPHPYLVKQLVSFITRYNYEFDKQPVIRDLEDVEVDYNSEGMNEEPYITKVQNCHNVISRISKFYNNLFSMDPIYMYI